MGHAQGLPAYMVQGKPVGQVVVASMRLWLDRYKIHHQEMSMADYPDAPSSLSQVSCEFTRGYLEAAFFSTSVEDRPGEEHLDDAHGVENMAPVTWAAVQRDCNAFLETNKALIEACTYSHKPGSADDTVLAHAGRDFWYTRAGHGCGFWDGDWPEAAGEHLTASAGAFGNVDLYLGDDEMIYQSGDEHRLCADGVPVLTPPPASVFPADEPSTNVSP